MAVTTMPPTRSPQRDLHFMGDPSLWLTWPFLPLVRRHPRNRKGYGVLCDTRSLSRLTGYRCTVFLDNLFTLPRHVDQLLALPKEVYDTFDEVVAAGWRVD